MTHDRGTILVIDDETDLLELLKEVLTSEGYRVETARDGQEGLKQLAKTPPDLIILDINMPRMGGISFYHRIADPDGHARYPLLVLTARAQLEQLFRELEVDAFMTKPFRIEDLMVQIRSIFAKHYGQAARDAGVSPSRKRKVLIADGDAAACRRIALAFLEAGWSVTTATTAVEALEQAIADVPDLAVLNVGLPDLPGNLAATRLAQMPRTSGVEVVLYAPEDRDLTEHPVDKAGGRRLVRSCDPQAILAESRRAIPK